MAAYAGDIWGTLPADYPTAQAERVYRGLLDSIPAGSFPRELMGYGFKGAAYRFRASADYQEEFETSVSAPGGAAPSADGEFLQEKCLFGFFASGLAALESLTFAIHAVSAHQTPTSFKCDPSSLRAVSPESVAKRLARKWPMWPITNDLSSLVSGQEFKDWKELRNILSHRMVPPRLIQIGGTTKSFWHLTKAKIAAIDEPLSAITVARRKWLATQVARLWDAMEATWPPPP